MKRRRLASFFLSLIVAASFMLSCGTSSSNESHQLQSISLTPTAADAQDFPNGQVQFTATGHYSSEPMAVTPLTAGWGSCFQQATTSDVVVSKEGIAQCAAGAVGTFTVWANDPGPHGTCNAVTACGGGCLTAGTAQLTCP